MRTIIGAFVAGVTITLGCVGRSVDPTMALINIVGGLVLLGLTVMYLEKTEK